MVTKSAVYGFFYNLIIRPSLNATVLVNEKVLEESAEYTLSHNDQVNIEGRCFTFEAATNGLTASFVETKTTTTTAADLPAEEEKKKNSPLCPVVEASLETLNPTADCRTPSSVSLKKPNNNPTTTAAASAEKVKSTLIAGAPQRALKTATTTGLASRLPLSVQFNRFSEQKGLTSRKRVYVPTKLFDGEKPSKQLDDEVDEKALSHNDLVTVVEESHNSLTASFIEMETTTTAAAVLPAEEENNNLLHSVVGTNTADDCRTPSSVSLKEPSNPATATTASSSVVVKSAPIVPRRALKTAAKTTGLASRQPPNVQFSCFSEQKGVTSRKRACFSTKLFDGEKPSKQKDDAVDDKAENALNHNDLVTTVEEDHNNQTDSFIETATALETTSAAAAAALPAAEEEDNSPPHSVVEMSLETLSTAADCRTPRFVTLKEPNSPGKSAAVASVKSTPIALRRALKTAAKTTGLASRQLPPNVQFNCLSEQKGVTFRKRVCLSTKLFDGEKPTGEQLDDALDKNAENAQISLNDLVTTVEEKDHNSLTDSFIETATAAEITTTTVSETTTALPAAVEENNSPLRPVVEASSETDNTADCQTPSSVSLKKPKSPATAADSDEPAEEEEVEENNSPLRPVDHHSLTESFIEKATTSESTTTTTTAAADLPVAEEEEKNSPLRPVVEASLETPSTTDACRTPASVSLKEPNSHPTTAASSASSSASSVVVISTPTAGLRCALKTTTSSSSAKRQPLSVQFNRFSEQKSLTSRKRVSVHTKLFDGEKPADEQLDEAVGEKAENALSHNHHHNKLIIRPSLNATVLVNEKVLEENAETALSHNDRVTVESQSSEEDHNNQTESLIEKATTLETTTTTAAADLPAADEEANSSPLHSVVEASSEANTTTTDSAHCQTPTSVTLKEPSNPATATTTAASASSAVVVKSTPTAAAAAAGAPRRALKTAAKTTGLASRQPPNVQFSCFSEQKGVTSRKRACFSTKLFDGEKLTDELDEAVGEKAENALSHNDLVTTVEEDHNNQTDSFIETATALETTSAAAALPAAEKEENNSPLHLVVEASSETDTTDDCRTPSSVTLKEPNNQATASVASAMVVKSFLFLIN